MGVQEDQRIADLIREARLAGRTLEAASVPIGDDRAYRVQAALTAGRLRAGEHVVGWKLGYTSPVMREALGIDEPNAGPLTDAMFHASPARLSGGLLQPRCEPEIAVVLAADGTIAALRPAVEVVDSVWAGYRFDWAHNTADGSSAAAAVIADDRVPLDWVVRATVEMTTSAGETSHGAVAAQLPDLQASVGWLRGLLSDRGEALAGGCVVLTGGLLAPVPLVPGGWVRARFSAAGRADVTVEVERRA
jgi:2-keto-4-pentenoate hydratase